MKVQFIGKGDKILYCDDEIVRITKEKTFFKKEEVKEKNVWDFMKAEIYMDSCIRFYDHYGELWDEIYFKKEYLERTNRIVEKIKIESSIYRESLKDDIFKSNVNLIPIINETLKEKVKNESEFIEEVFTLSPKVFQLYQPVKIFFKGNSWDLMSYERVLWAAQTMYDIIYEIFIEVGYIFKDSTDIEIQCFKTTGEEIITFSSIDKKVIEKMEKEGKLILPYKTEI